MKFYLHLLIIHDLGNYTVILNRRYAVINCTFSEPVVTPLFYLFINSDTNFRYSTLIGMHTLKACNEVEAKNILIVSAFLLIFPIRCL
jgi:hypothetical protein